MSSDSDQEGIEIGMHRSCKMTPELLRRATLILGMTSFHVQMALRMSPEARGKTFLLKEYVGAGSKNSQIQDPMGCTLEVYKKVFKEIRKACKVLAKMDLHTPGPPALKRKASGKKGEEFDDLDASLASSEESASSTSEKKTASKAKASARNVEGKAPKAPAATKPATKPAAKSVAKPAAKPEPAKKAAKSGLAKPNPWPNPRPNRKRKRLKGKKPQSAKVRPNQPNPANRPSNRLPG
jgi:outer membrane biosynthesis protein TonB